MIEGRPCVLVQEPAVSDIRSWNFHGRGICAPSQPIHPRRVIVPQCAGVMSARWRSSYRHLASKSETAITPKENEMNKTILAAATALLLSWSLASAQPSQGQAGANTGPTSNSANSEKAPMTNGAMKDGAMQGGATSGTSSGGGSGMTTSGGANGNPGAMPKTTTGPTGAASKDESPPK
jgi:hypothetical protein